MNIQDQIQHYIDSQPEEKRNDMQELQKHILQALPGTKLWFLDGKNNEGKVVSNPNIGYGSYIIKYANGSTKEFYQIGLSANTTGISVYVMGLEDKKYLATTFRETLGKASITGYCIKFKKLADINIDVLLSAIDYGIETTKKK